MGKKARRNPFIMLFELLLLIGVPILCHLLWPLVQLINGWWRCSGVVLMLLGLLLTSAAACEFRRAGTGFRLKDGGASLVTSGPFRYSRNPIYLGMLLWLFGLAALLGSLMAFLFPLIMFILANFLLISPEERKLQDTYGEAFTRYRQRVRRWV